MIKRFLYFLSLLFLGSQIALAQSLQVNLASSEPNSFLSRYIPFDASKSLTAEQVQKDIWYLELAIKNISGLYKFSPDKSGQQFINSLQTTQVVGMSAIEFCSLLQQKSSLFNDGHFAVVTENMACNGRLDKKGAVGLAGSNYGKKLDATWELNYFQNGRTRIPILSIHHFSQPQDTAWNGFLEAAKNLRDHEHVFVIDMRGNSGGSDVMGAKLANVLYDGNPPTPYASIIYGNSREVFESWQNLISIFKIKKERLHEDTSIETQMIEDYRQKAILASEGKIPPTQLKSFKSDIEKPGKNHFSGEIFLLIDRSCASSCESTTDFLRSLPFVITVGENTSGAIHYGNVGFVQLPNSKIGFSMGTSYAKYRDGIIHEMTGISPRIQVPSGTDALDAIIPTIVAFRSKLAIRAR